MTREERKIRFDIAVDIVNSVYTDICHDNSFSREEVREFCDFLIDMQNFGSKSFFNEPSLNNKIRSCEEMCKNDNNRDKFGSMDWTER